MSGPRPFPPAPASIEKNSESTLSEGNLAALASRFSTPAGGGLPPDLSLELAFEIVLNEIVEQACLSTGATGAAIVLRRGNEMVCRASSGSTAPPLGARLSTNSGLVGECVRTMRAQRSGDVLSDPRADVEASLRLGIRSAMLMPLTRSGELIGFFELFSPNPQAFGDSDERILEDLARQVMANLQRSTEPLLIPTAETSAPRDNQVPTSSQLSLLTPMDSSSSTDEELKESLSSRFDLTTSALTVAVVGSALLLGVLVGRHSLLHRLTRHSVPAAAPPSEPVEASARAMETPKAQRGAPSVSSAAAPVGGLVVFQDGKEVFRLPSTSAGQSSDDPLHTAITRDSENLATPEARRVSDGELITRVEPIYPEEALRQRLQDSVVLNVQIGPDGSVERADVVRGAPLLAAASVDAVKQWKFKPHVVNGVATPMQTHVTLNFKLTQGS